MQVVLDQKNNYDHLLCQKFVSGNFLQSSLWRDFLGRQNKKYWQLVIRDHEKVLGISLVYESKLPMGLSYLCSPKGPIYFDQPSAKKRNEAGKLLLSKARDICLSTKKREEVFFRLEPANNPQIKELKKSKDIQPRDTWVISLEKNEEEILSSMSQKTRYNINLAARKGVKIRFSQEKKDLHYFLDLIKLTATRNQISVHSDHYYQLLWETLLDNRAGLLALAEVKGKIIASNLLVKFGQTMTYLHGGSDYRYRNYMAPQLLQWECIKEAKAAGFLVYDFWGVAPKDKSQKHWQGITRFKKGFGGQRISSPGAYDFVYHPTWYQVYHLARPIINKLRNLR